ncbi:hypothetical protein [Hymenobacter coccineus]|uniref:Glycosyltransferase RgtA/B/C/D-like domain-containing protein n=1 Tax=Hymenobacter coccineus TaxID=1908235 RepID=A0A1G1T1X6_9BACT|nr:hypothetical protein [Hymenobacter coccineus]OGX84872.1 hypothetical protein BEN49_01900 [Hymenobacter coccineus]
MLRFFRGSLPAQLLGLLLLLLALRLPLLLLQGLPLTAGELRAMLVGERVHGGALPYRDLYDRTAPLAAYLFGGLDWVGARPIFLYRALALALLLLQALRLNFVLNRADAFPDRGYLVALVYLVVGCLSTDLDALSPLLVGHTFVLFALSALLPTSREGYDNRRLFRAGFLVGLAGLCYLPLVLFAGVGLLAVIIFAANAFRSFLLLLCGLFFPYAVAVTYFLYAGALPNFVQFHLEPAWLSFRTGAPGGLPLPVQLRLLALPAAVLLLAVLRGLSTPLGPVFQAKFRQLMVAWLLVDLAVLAAGGGTAPGALVLLLPSLAYFSLFLWQAGRPAWAPEATFLLLLAAVVVVRYRTLVPGLETVLRLPTESSFSTRPDPALTNLRNQHLLVLGSDQRAYLTNSSATPYLDWDLALRDFGYLNQYAAVVRIGRQVGADPPPYLLDQSHLLPQLRHLLPSVFGSYVPAGPDGLYRRTKTGK